jgi:1-acyl-sn-glycerol-3-phosphate acyltransferase
MLTTVRSLLYFGAMSVTVLIYGVVVGGPARLLSTDRIDRLSNTWGAINLFLLRWICGLRFEVEGFEHLPPSGAVIVMAKHQSTWETIALRAILRPDQSWVLKQELMRIPFFGWGLSAVKSIPIDRSAGRRAVVKVVELGRRYLDEGRQVIIFPEGTRTAPGERKKYGIGGGVLAERTGVPVLPVAHNAGVFWRRRGVKKYPGTIRVVIGPVILTEGKKSTKIVAEVEEWIESIQEELPLTVD